MKPFGKDTPLNEKQKGSPLREDAS